MNKELSSPGATNPMLYDPLPNDAIQTSKKMQFVAAVFSKSITSNHIMSKYMHLVQNITNFKLKKTIVERSHETN